MLIIGIDPGISGAICFFEDGEVKNIIDMPSMAEGKKNKRQINGNQLYNEIINAGTHKAPSIRVAEAAKVIENTQRDLNIALINELSILFNMLLSSNLKLHQGLDPTP